jgi:hypothetical protein
MDNIVFSKHALKQMEVRCISKEQVWEVVQNPEQVIKYDSETVIFQSKLNFADGNYLVRVFINVIKVPKLIITVYRTGKIEKYWEDEG